jgi:hypothetical protein
MFAICAVGECSRLIFFTPLAEIVITHVRARRFKITLLALGCAAIALSLLIYVARPAGAAFQISAAGIEKQLIYKLETGEPGPADWATIRAVLAIKVDQQAPVRLGDSIVLQLVATPQYVSLVPSSNLTHGPAGPPATQAPGMEGPSHPTDLENPSHPPSANVPSYFSLTNQQMMNQVREDMKAGRVAFSLSLAGASVQPSGRNAVTEAGVASWSIAPSAAGTIRGFIAPDFLSSRGGHNGQYRTEYTAEDNLPIVITTIEPFFTRKTIVSGIVGFFGSLLTLPGIISFIRERRGAKPAPASPNSYENDG